MNKTIRLVVISASLAVVSQAAPFLAIGDGAELFATGMLGARADDNILLTKNNRVSDVIIDINPGVELTFGKNAQLKGALTLVDAFANYTDHSKYNTNLASGDFVARYDDAKMKLGGYLGYHEVNQNTADVRGLIRRDISTAGANGEVSVSEITTVAAAVDFAHENYHPAGFSDSDILTVPVDFYYKFSPKLDLGLGYRYRDTQESIGQDATDHFINVSARGEFSPKLTGKAAIGYNIRKLQNGGGDKHDIGLDASLAYEITPKTTLQVGASNDFGQNPHGQQQRNLTLNGLATMKLTEEWSVRGGASYRKIYYSRLGTSAPRSDDYWEGTLGASYILNANIRFVGNYIYRTYSVGNVALSASEFDNNVFSIAANFRY
jgi:polysaccharide biosynthesis protein VpsM